MKKFALLAYTRDDKEHGEVTFTIDSGDFEPSILKGNHIDSLVNAIIQGAKEDPDEAFITIEDVGVSESQKGGKIVFVCSEELPEKLITTYIKQFLLLTLIASIPN